MEVRSSALWGLIDDDIIPRLPDTSTEDLDAAISLLTSAAANTVFGQKNLLWIARLAQCNAVSDRSSTTRGTPAVPRRRGMPERSLGF